MIDDEEFAVHDNFDNESFDDFDIGPEGECLNGSIYDTDQPRSMEKKKISLPGKTPKPPLSVIPEESRVDTDIISSDKENIESDPFGDSFGLRCSLKGSNFDINESAAFSSGIEAMKLFKKAEESFDKSGRAHFITEDPRFDCMNFNKENSWEPSPPSFYAKAKDDPDTTPKRGSERSTSSSFFKQRSINERPVMKETRFKDYDDDHDKELPVKSLREHATTPRKPSRVGSRIMADRAILSPESKSVSTKASTPNGRGNAPLPAFDISEIPGENNDSVSEEPKGDKSPRHSNDDSNVSDVSSINQSAVNDILSTAKHESCDALIERLEMIRKRGPLIHRTVGRTNMPPPPQCLTVVKDKDNDVVNKFQNLSILSKSKSHYQKQNIEKKKENSFHDSSHLASRPSSSALTSRPPTGMSSRPPTGMSTRPSTGMSVNSQSDNPLRIDSRYLMFGFLDVGDSEILNVNLTNRTTQPMRLKLTLRNPNCGYTITSGGIMSLQSSEAMPVSISFRPNEYARVNNTLIVSIISGTHTGLNYSVFLRGSGGVANLVPEAQKDLMVTSNKGFFIRTANRSSLTFDVKNKGVREAFCKVLLFYGGSVLNTKISPSSSFILKRNHTQSIVIEVSNLQSYLSSDFRSSSQSLGGYACSRNSSMSSQHGQADMKIILLWGEECQRQRLKCFGKKYRKNVDVQDVDFTVPFLGEQTDFVPPEDFPVQPKDITIFTTYLRKTEIPVVSVFASNAMLALPIDCDATFGPDTTIMYRNPIDRTVVGDVTVANPLRRGE
ncbi:unnamed protein product [Auanema sp. JU1783]|nr:unnamed protein product [Auanema sp. JU1783]